MVGQERIGEVQARAARRSGRDLDVVSTDVRRGSIGRAERGDNFI